MDVWFPSGGGGNETDGLADKFLGMHHTSSESHVALGESDDSW